MKDKLEKASKKKTLIGWSIFLAVFIILSIIVLLIWMGTNENGWSKFGEAFSFLVSVVYLDNFLRQPVLLIGTLVFVGYLVLGRGLVESFTGAMKSSIGILLMGIGSGMLVGMARPVFNGLQTLGEGTTVVPLDPYFALTIANPTGFLSRLAGEGFTYAAWVIYAFLGGLIINIILVVFKKWTNVHSIVITGHIMIQQATVLVAFLYFLLFRETELSAGGVKSGPEWAMIIMSSIMLGVYWGVGSTSTIKPTNTVTENAGFAIGHQQMLSISVAYKLGKYVGKKENSAETRVLPKWLKIFEDNIFTQTFILLILFSILMIILFVSNKVNYDWGKREFRGDFGSWNALSSGAWVGLQFIFGAFKITASILTLITGVRMFVTELQQSFQGISEKIIPDSVVAVDIAAVYGFAPNSITYGFISGTLAQFAAVGLVIALSRIPGLSISITIPLFITLFFNSGALAAYSNASGGIKGAIIVPAVIGIFEILIISFALGAVTHVSTAAMPGIVPDPETLKPQTPVPGGFIGMADWNLFFGAYILVSAWSTAGAWIFTILAILGLLFYGQALDSGMQHKKTFVQKFLKLNPELISANKKA
ncbi:PTS ascorbate transporter subunit IIC [Mycoplasma iguanae]|uniref:Ascorbate-specific PTS system EIIC component n=1 Tax=Mycoplasma iguanae TaxID=292461 RepID=A0ABY5RCE0_9MOLU|nr:PTS ascorbate transporter subunit IIC [Mycoplasma iguanae]UVD81880.1 PTS ascorbate transporter subunit IIC [Mycoplasma iguanae]